MWRKGKRASRGRADLIPGQRVEAWPVPSDRMAILEVLQKLAESKDPPAETRIRKLVDMLDSR